MRGPLRPLTALFVLAHHAEAAAALAHEALTGCRHIEKRDRDAAVSRTGDGGRAENHKRPKRDRGKEVH